MIDVLSCTSEVNSKISKSTSTPAAFGKKCNFQHLNLTVSREVYNEFPLLLQAMIHLDWTVIVVYSPQGHLWLSIGKMFHVYFQRGRKLRRI